MGACFSTLTPSFSGFFRSCSLGFSGSGRFLVSGAAARVNCVELWGGRMDPGVPVAGGIVLRGSGEFAGARLFQIRGFFSECVCGPVGVGKGGHSSGYFFFHLHADCLFGGPWSGEGRVRAILGVCVVCNVFSAPDCRTGIGSPPDSAAVHRAAALLLEAGPCGAWSLYFCGGSGQKALACGCAWRICKQGV
jgi:hypothetical protein